MAKMTVKQVRTLLGKEYKRLPDSDIEKLIEELMVLADIIVDAYLDKKKKETKFK